MVFSINGSSPFKSIEPCGKKHTRYEIPTSFFEGPGHIEDENILFGCIAEMDTKTPPEHILVVKMVKMANDP